MIVADRGASLVTAIYKNDSAVGRFIPGRQGRCQIMIPTRTIERKALWLERVRHSAVSDQ
jgi:hypothetical protein